MIALLLTIALAQGGYDSPCPCCVPQTFTPELHEGFDHECVQAIVDWADQQIELARVECYTLGLRLYDEWSWDLWYCGQWYGYTTCGPSLACALKKSMCDDLAHDALFHALIINEQQYGTVIVDVTLTAQWQIDTYCY